MKAIGYALALALTSTPVTFAPGTAPTKDAGGTRQPALVGWYPQERAELVALAHLLMRVGMPQGPTLTRPVALVSPHAGWNFSGIVAGAAFRQLKRGDFERVVVVGPSHYQAFRGFALDDRRAYRTPIGETPVCDGATAALSGADARPLPGATDKEHSVEVELPFLQAALGRFCLVPIVVGETSADQEKAFAARLAKLADERTLFVFSSDFAHYGPRFDYQPFGPLSPETRKKVRELNERAVALLAQGDAPGFRAYLAETGNTICGRNGLATMLELLPLIAPKATAVKLAQYASSDIPGMQDTSSVSYVSMAFLREPVPATAALVAPPQLEDAPLDTPALGAEAGARLVRLARAALDTELRGTDDLERQLADFPSGRAQERRQGVFVTLNRRDPAEIRRHGKLRGCIGQPQPTFPLYYGTPKAALDAALRDPRFEPVAAAELPRLEVEVTVLSPRKRIASYEEIRIGTHGVVLEKGDRAALFLPQVAPEQGWNVEQMLDALATKAGLPKRAWREGATLSVFTGQVFEEHP